MKIKLVRIQGRLPVGLVAEARKLPGGVIEWLTPYQIIDGEFVGVEVQITNCIELPDEPTHSLAEYTAVHQELLQRREEVKNLMYRIDVAVTVRGRVEAVADRLQDNVVQLNKKLREEREGKKVVLPREVAEAIDSIKSDGHDVDYIAYYLTEYIVSENLTKRMQSLRRYAQLSGFTLFSALVNGYTIEQTKDERFSAGVTDLMREWHNEGDAIKLSRQIDALHMSIYSETASG